MGKASGPFQERQAEKIICTTEVMTMQRIDALPASSAGVSVLCPVVGATHLSPLMRARHAFAAPSATRPCSPTHARQRRAVTH